MELRINKNSSQRGFTLVELLVGLVLTLFIGAIAMTYMVSSSQSFRVQANDAFSQENARFALEILGQNVRLAGLNPENDFRFTMDVIYNGNICVGSEAAQATGQTTSCTIDDLASGSDRFAIDYIAPTDVVACNGTTVSVTGDSQRLVNVFWTGDIDGDGVRSLYCQTMNVTDSSVVGTAVPLVDGIDAMQVQYGVDSPDGSGNFDGYVDRYQSYTNLISGAANLADRTQRVKTVRIALLVNSGAIEDATANIQERENRTFNLLDGAPISRDDRIFRQIYSTTIHIPNS